MNLPQVGGFLLSAVGLVYLYVSIERFKHDPWLSVMFLGYAIAQIGVVMKALEK